MGKLHKKVVGALRKELDDFQDALVDLPGGRVSGVIVSSSFESLSHRARQAKLKAIVARALTLDERSALGAIAALTPAEATVKAI